MPASCLTDHTCISNVCGARRPWTSIPLPLGGNREKPATSQHSSSCHRAESQGDGAAVTTSHFSSIAHGSGVWGGQGSHVHLTQALRAVFPHPPQHLITHVGTRSSLGSGQDVCGPWLFCWLPSSPPWGKMTMGWASGLQAVFSESLVSQGCPRSCCYQRYVGFPWGGSGIPTE